MPKRTKPENIVLSESDATILKFLRGQKSKSLVPISFKVPQQLHLEYKLTAAQHGISMVDLLKESFELWKSHNKR